MNSESTPRPMARRARLLIEHVGDDTIVYDEDRRTAHSLNRAAALVWRQCDGTRNTKELAALLCGELAGAADETVVTYALDQLRRAHLLENAAPDAKHMTRRDVVRRMAIVGIAVTIPTVVSIAAPTPAMAASTPTPPPDPGGDG